MTVAIHGTCMHIHLQNCNACIHLRFQFNMTKTNLNVFYLEQWQFNTLKKIVCMKAV